MTVKFVERKGGGDLSTNPFYNLKTYVGNKPFKSNGYQCVDYAIQRSQELAEAKCVYYSSLNEKADSCENPIFKRSGYGNATNFLSDTKWSWSIDNPRLGDIVVYGSAWGKGYGHVRIVERIENGYMILSGANEDYNGSVKFGIKTPITKGGGIGASGLQGYIHNPFLSDSIQDDDWKAKYEALEREFEEYKQFINTNVKNALKGTNVVIEKIIEVIK